MLVNPMITLPLILEFQAVLYIAFYRGSADSNSELSAWATSAHMCFRTSLDHTHLFSWKIQWFHTTLKYCFAKDNETPWVRIYFELYLFSTHLHVFGRQMLINKTPVGLFVYSKISWKTNIYSNFEMISLLDKIRFLFHIMKLRAQPTWRIICVF